MEKIIEQIKKYYLKYLTPEERENLSSNPSEDFIRKIVNKIWQLYLTEPFNYEDGKDFRFLVSPTKEVVIAAFDPNEGIISIPFKDLPSNQTKTHLIKLITNKTLKKEDYNDTGYIANINWLKTDKILLPEDFIGSSQTIESELDPVGIYNVNVGEEIINSAYERSLETSDEYKLLFVSLNKKSYDKSYELSPKIINSIVTDIICLYLVYINQTLNVKLRDELYTKYHNYIARKYKNMSEDEDFNPSDFLSLILAYIKKSENIIEPKL